ncbi:hypothetical protein RirG_244550 [Rhizophagus irregularis DAOM 197198w]|uniref:DDE-1 domain-containing protein n=1 Tax=Rhizophagus irregularis (strain DAOM 197198w) TaxID=1432141 RepID=A0A015IH55_RHIIW|nr:hypothetical protein RirG_244550 [Rhizophagus irregularis DAOM 197198w]
MPPDRKGKRKVAEGTSKRKSLSFAEKKELCEWKRDNPSYNQENLAKKFGISKPQEFKDQKWDRGAKYPEIESALQINRAGEANSAPLEILEEERKILQEIIKQYDPCNVYNVDETALFWNLEPSKTLSDHYISGTKKSKNRITVVLTCNADGSHKLPALVIHKWQTSRVLKGIKKDDLPVWYYWNRTAWMQVSV